MLIKCLFTLILIQFVWSRTSENLKVQLSDGSRLVGRYLTSDSGNYSGISMNELLMDYLV
jgi:hypothetical protein